MTMDRDMCMCGITVHTHILIYCMSKHTHTTHTIHTHCISCTFTHVLYMCKYLQMDTPHACIIVYIYDVCLHILYADMYMYYIHISIYSIYIHACMMYIHLQIFTHICP